MGRSFFGPKKGKKPKYVHIGFRGLQIPLNHEQCPNSTTANSSDHREQKNTSEEKTKIERREQKIEKTHMGGDLLSEIRRSFLPGLPCQHSGFIGSLCTRCGKDKPECGDPPTRPFSYIEPGFALTMPEIERLRNVNLKTLIGSKKLHLVLDLDNTLVHSTLSQNLTLEERDHLMEKYATEGLLSEVCDGAVVVKLRPGARDFLQKASTMFDLSVFTKGRRDYAEEAARVLDPDGLRFGSRRWRVMSREDCFMGKQKRLDVVLAHNRVVLIVDDNEQVWAHNNKANLIKIAPYRFFLPPKNPSKAVAPQYRFQDDEAKEKGEFTRVLNTLKEVHEAFYSDSFMVEYGHVRHLLKKFRCIIDQ